MYVSTCKGGANGQYTYVRLMESYRDENGKVKHKVVQNLGRLDILSQSDPNYLENLKKKYQEDYAEKSRLQSLNRLAQVQSLLSFDNNSSAGAPLPLLQYGHYLLKKIWDDHLHLNRKFKDIQHRQTKAKFDLNAVVSYLCFLKILDPHSVFYSFGDQDGFLGAPVQGIGLDSYYDSYDYLFEHKDSIMRFFNRSINNQLGKTKATLIFYDVTNVYFETALTDLECGRQQMDFQDRLQEEVQLAYENGELDAACFDKEGRLMPSQKTDDFIKKIQAQKIEYLRMRGPSKEHRFDLPLASIALVINEEGIPIDFYVYAGNASEFKTMAASIESLKQKYNVKESIVVADRGLNSAANLKMLQSNDLGFLMAQKVSNLDQKTTKAMFDPEGYIPIIKQGEQVARFKVVGKSRIADGNAGLVADDAFIGGKGEGVALVQHDFAVFERADAVFGTLGVQQDRDRQVQLLADAPDLFDMVKVIRMRAVRKVEARDIHAGAAHLCESGFIRAGGTDGADDFGFSHVWLLLW